MFDRAQLEQAVTEQIESTHSVLWGRTFVVRGQKDEERDKATQWMVDQMVSVLSRAGVELAAE